MKGQSLFKRSQISGVFGRTHFIQQWFGPLSMPENHLQGAVKLRSSTRNFDLLGLAPENLHFYKFSGDVDAASLGPQFENHFKVISMTVNSSLSQHHQQHWFAISKNNYN